MVQRFFVGGLLLLTLPTLARSDDQVGSKVPHPGLERLKKLAGTWVAADKDGKATDQVVSVVKVTAAGSAVHETLFPGQPHEMVSVVLLRWGRTDHDSLLRTGQPAAHEGRPEVASQPAALPVRGRLESGPREGQAHARGDDHLR